VLRDNEIAYVNEVNALSFIVNVVLANAILVRPLVGKEPSGSLKSREFLEQRSDLVSQEVLCSMD
jgi:hypothetical protein